MVYLPLLRLYHRLVQAHSISQSYVFHFLSNKWVILTWSLSPDRYAHVKYLEKAGSTAFTAGNRRPLAPIGHLSSLWQSRSTLKETSWRHLLCAEDPIAFRQHPLRGALERFSAFFVFCLFSFYASEPRCLFKTHTCTERKALRFEEPKQANSTQLPSVWWYWTEGQSHWWRDALSVEGPIIQLAFGSWRLLGALCLRLGAQCPRLKSMSPALTVLAGY